MKEVSFYGSGYGIQQKALGILSKFHHPHNFQIKEGMNNISVQYGTKSEKFSTAMNMKTHILLVISFQSCGYE